MHARIAATFLVLVIAHFPAVSAAAQQHPHAPLDPLCAELKMPNDPAVHREYGCYYFGNYVWNDGSGAGNVTGRIYWPSDCSSSTPPGVHPLVLLMHGDGHAYTDYGYLMSHLARNGFIAATISNSGSNLERTGQALTYLGFIRNHWTHKTHVQNNIGLIGHSRGGEAVLTVARRIEELGLTHDVNAIISLAPTDNAEGGGAHESIEGGESESFLVIYGTDDEDVFGWCVDGPLPSCAVPLSEPMHTGFALYDRAGSEGETEPFPLYDEVVTKAMLFVERANHNKWRSECIDTAITSLISCDAHWNIARGYVNAFLRWQLREESIYKDFFTGRWMPPSVAAEGVRIHTQYSEGYGRRVLDNFEQGGAGTNTLGGSLTSGGAIQVVTEGTTWDYDSTSPHDTRSLVVHWAPPGLAPWLRSFLPNGTTPLGARWRDVRGFDFFSLRAGQVYDSPFNTEDAPKEFYVEFRDAFGGSSGLISTGQYAELPYPRDTQVLYAGQLIHVAKSPMTTVRIPLCGVKNVDFENLSQVYFWFTAPGSSSGEMLLDNLEFTD
jgi:hypothetical protein